MVSREGEVDKKKAWWMSASGDILVAEEYGRDTSRGVRSWWSIGIYEMEYVGCRGAETSWM